MTIDCRAEPAPEASIRGSTTISADQIPVRHFRQTLYWPLALVVPPKSLDDGAGFLGAVSNQTAPLEAMPSGSRGWRRLCDPLEHLPITKPQDRRDAYAEFVYFHDFIQRFLYRRQPTEPNGRHSFDEPFRLYARTDVTHLDVAFSGGGPDRTARFDVDRCLLYVFRTGVAIFVADLSITPDPNNPVGSSLPDLTGPCVNDALRLSDVQTLLDLVRRAYSPYFVDGPALSPLVVKKARWLGSGDYPPTGHDVLLSVNEVDRLFDQTGERAPPVFAHWRELLPAHWKLGGDPRKDVVWRHIVDERMPVSACVSVGEPGKDDERSSWYRAVSRNDLVRLCFADKEENPADRGPPYDPASITNFEANHCYRRFDSFGTLYLVSGYGFVQILSGSDFAEGVFATHMRRHYYQIMLLAQFELASMLTFSSRITGLVSAHDAEISNGSEDADERLEARMRALQSETMDFIHRFRFTGVTNQLQGQELSALLRRHLRIDEVFGDLREEIDNGAALLARRAQDIETSSAAQLSVVATFGLAASVATSLLGMNVFFGETMLKRLADPETEPVVALLAQGVVACVTVSLVFFLAALVLKRTYVGRTTRQDRRLRGVRRLLYRIALFALALAVGLGVTSWLRKTPSKAPAENAQSAAPAAAKP